MYDLTTAENNYDTGKDNIIIIEQFENIPGGKTADASGLADDIKNVVAGHVVIKETSTGNVKLLGVTGSAGAYTYAALPGGHTYLGIVRATVPKAKPFVSVMVRGTVNEEAYKNVTSLVYPQGAKDALTLIRFTKED